MNLDTLAALSRSVDAVICWLLAPKWRRGKLSKRVKRAYHGTDRGTSDCTYPIRSECELRCGGKQRKLGVRA